MENDSEVSKTQRKREMQALQNLGEELVGLPAKQLAALELPDRLRDAVLEARRITKFGARRRQLQYVARLMREVDAESIRIQLGASRVQAARQTARFHRTERWRARLLSEESALAEFVDSHPSADAGRLQVALRDAQREAQGAGTQHAARALFRAIREAIDKDENKS